jgi:tetratricopeptide (TPR) repeat protein
MSGALIDLGRYDEASRYAEDAVAIVRASHAGGDHARLRHQAFILFGHLQVLRGDYREARACFARARRVAQAHDLGPVATARALNGLGVVAKYTGRWASGARYYRLALRAVGPADGPHWPMAATLLHNLGGLEHARGRFARAERWARRGLTLREKNGVPSSVERGTDLAALAAIVHARGDLGEAARLYRRASTLLHRRLGADHFEIAFNLGQMAALEHSRGRLVESRRLYRRALPRLERILGREHPVVARVKANFAELRAEKV